MKTATILFLCLAFGNVFAREKVEIGKEVTHSLWMHYEYEEPYCRPLPVVDCSSISEYLVPPNSGYCGLNQSFAILCHHVPGLGLVGLYIPDEPKPEVREFANGVH